MQTKLLAEALKRDLDRFHGCFDHEQDAQTRIRHRMITTIMDDVMTEPIEYATAAVVVELLISVTRETASR